MFGTFKGYEVILYLEFEQSDVDSFLVEVLKLLDTLR